MTETENATSSEDAQRDENKTIHIHPNTSSLPVPVPDAVPRGPTVLSTRNLSGRRSSWVSVAAFGEETKNIELAARSTKETEAPQWEATESLSPFDEMPDRSSRSVSFRRVPSAP